MERENVEDSEAEKDDDEAPVVSNGRFRFEPPLDHNGNTGSFGNFVLLVDEPHCISDDPIVEPPLESSD